jgi:hypothetical protein
VITTANSKHKNKEQYGISTDSKKSIKWDLPLHGQHEHKKGPFI